MVELELPALNGLDPLGFLAALGAFRLTADHLDSEARLGWSVATGSAVLASRFDSTTSLAQALANVAQSVPDGGVLPGVPAAFPETRTGSKGGDPVRVVRADYGPRLAQIADEHGPQASRWFEHIVSDLDEDRTGRAVLTPWMAPSGQQTVRSFFEKSLALVRAKPETIHEALTGWRRHNDFTGEYLDHRVLNDAAASATGQSDERGVPGATWLAAMALPMLRATAVGGRPAGTLWRHRGHEWVAVWPLWQPLLDQAAVVVLLEHPDLSPTSLNRARLTALGVFRVGAAKRRGVEGRKSAGVLVPVAMALG